jgi:transcriptional regulator with XRE-family HTH domain
MNNLIFSPQQMLREILQLTDYTLTQISEETGISRSTLSRIYHNCSGIIHLRNFNKLLRLYCQLIAKNVVKK